MEKHMKHTKRLLSLLLTLCLLLGLLPTATLAAEELPSTCKAGCSLEAGHEGDCVLHETRYQTARGGPWAYGSLSDACANVYEGGGVVLLRDVELEAGVTVTKPLTITSADPQNPCTITYGPQDRGDCLLTVRASGSVTLTNLILDGGREVGKTAQAELVWAVTGVLILGDGAILQNNDNVSGSTPSAGGLYVTWQAQVQLRPGSSVRNCRGGAGGGVAVNGGGNRPPSSAANYHLILLGGIIEDCEAIQGGGVYVGSQGTVFLPAGQAGTRLQNNCAVMDPEDPDDTVKGCGGGMYVSLGYVQMFSGAAENNSAQNSGGGIFLNAGQVVLGGGMVTGNRAERFGGGVLVAPYVNGTTVTLGNSPCVAGNTSGAGYFHNIYLDKTEEVSVDDTHPITIAAPLKDDASVGVSRWLRPDEETPYRVVAMPAGGYTISDSDLAKFHSDDPKYVVLLKEGNIVLTTAKVLFDNQEHGPVVPGQELDDTHLVKEPEEEMTERGYAFEGWYTDPACEEETRWDFQQTITEDETDERRPILTLYAKWELNRYSITYDLGEGGENAAGNPDTYTVISPDIYLDPPTREGYRFVRWEVVEHTEKALRRRAVSRSASPDIPTDSIGNWVFRAVWEELPRYTVTYSDGVGGAAFVDQVTENVYKGTDTPAFVGTPARTGYTFAGWSPEVADTVTGNATYTARWEPVSYTITYELDGGVNAEGNPAAYTVESETITLEAPSKENYTFQGWTWEGQETPTVEAAIPKGSTGNKTFTAHWKKNAPPSPEITDVTDPEITGVADLLNTGDHIVYLHGYDTGEFGPDRDMTRAEVAQMFFNLLLKQNVAAAPAYEDVPPQAWYAEAVGAMRTLGIMQGVGNNRFEPNRPISRAEFTVTAMRFAKLDATGTNIFSDVTEEAWYYPQVVGSIKYGWINGYPDGTFRPDKTITRAEVTTVVNRMLGRSADQAYVDANTGLLKIFPDAADKKYWAYYDIVEATNAHDFEKKDGESWTGLRQASSPS